MGGKEISEMKTLFSFYEEKENIYFKHGNKFEQKKVGSFFRRWFTD